MFHVLQYGKLCNIFLSYFVVAVDPVTSIAQASWFIGMMVAIAVLILFLIIVCFIKRSRGEKYHGKTLKLTPLKRDTKLTVADFLSLKVYPFTYEYLTFFIFKITWMNTSGYKFVYM